ncbi:hypothetical protein CIPAW_08G153900 [Carya illinoinensis]|uniref:Uncharacterized protein n=1 Tax=Carya illinoinensis TaxID=32201 RepID=A0A8T1PWV0_CARIL|nr:hypothetical protein CIPAW_08G153900 [Carya illinoinensis]
MLGRFKNLSEDWGVLKISLSLSLSLAMFSQSESEISDGKIGPSEFEVSNGFLLFRSKSTVRRSDACIRFSESPLNLLKLIGFSDEIIYRKVFSPAPILLKPKHTLCVIR